VLAIAEPRARPKAERFYRPFRGWTHFSLGSRHFVPGFYFYSVPPGRPIGPLARTPTRRLRMCFSQHFVLGFYYQCPFGAKTSSHTTKPYVDAHAGPRDTAYPSNASARDRRNVPFFSE